MILIDLLILVVTTKTTKMDQQNQLFGLTIDPQSKRFLSETAKWGRFLSIIGFVLCILIAIVGVFMALKMSEVSSAFREMGGPLASLGPVIAFIYILFAVIYFFPCLYLPLSLPLSVSLSLLYRGEHIRYGFSSARIYELNNLISSSRLHVLVLALVIALDIT